MTNTYCVNEDLKKVADEKISHDACRRLEFNSGEGQEEERCGFIKIKKRQ